MITTTLRMPDDVYEDLRTLAFRDKVSQNKIVVAALEEYLDKRREADQKLSTLVDGQEKGEGR